MAMALPMLRPGFFRGVAAPKAFQTLSRLGLLKRPSQAATPGLHSCAQNITQLRTFRTTMRRLNTSKSTASGAESAEPEKMTISLMWKRYGLVALGTHFTVYFVTLVGLTVAVKEGVLGKTDEERAEAIEKVAVKLEPYIPVVAIDSIRSSPTVGAFAVAWVAAKFTEPVRLVATFFIVPRLARYLSRAPAKKIKDSMKK